VSEGATGESVKRIQERLGIAVTGTFDAATAAAVKRFKTTNGFNQDATVGPKVWEKLFQ
jgi:peptidoglycan hydrolase-like protein with peptidoglycan-binding domain